MSHLFTYGTLMCDDIMREVSSCSLRHAAATLARYGRKPVRGEEYPGLVPDSAGCVDGVIYWDVPDAAWERLDRFEGEMYERWTGRVMLADGRLAAAETYVVRPRYRDHLIDAEWDFAAFLRRGKERFENGYQGYAGL